MLVETDRSRPSHHRTGRRSDIPAAGSTTGRRRTGAHWPAHRRIVRPHHVLARGVHPRCRPAGTRHPDDHRACRRGPPGGTARRDHRDRFTAVARRVDGRLLVGSAAGAVYVLADQTSSGQTGSGQTSSGQTGSGQTGSDQTRVTAETTIFSRVDAIVTEGETAVVLDRAQTSVTALNQQGAVQQALRAGLGATTIAADPAGRVLVTDTRGGQLLVFSVDPLIQRQGYPIGESPYAIASSNTLVWVSQTAINSVAGYDLGTGIPVEKVRYPTVRQPNSLAFDEVSGTLYVVSGSGDGILVIRDAAGAP